VKTPGMAATRCVAEQARALVRGGALLVAALMIVMVMCSPAHALSRFDGIADEHFGDSGGPWNASVDTTGGDSQTLKQLFESTWESSHGGPTQYARMIIRYNAADLGGGCWDDAVRFYQYALAQGLTPVVSFWNQGAGQDCHDGDYSTALPATTDDYDTAIRHTIDGLQNATGQRPPYVEAWNEPNLGSAPSAATAAQYWIKAYYACGQGTSCTVIAGDFVDSRNGGTGSTTATAGPYCDASYTNVSTYEQTYINYLGTYMSGVGKPMPAQWGFHPYNAGRCNSAATINTLNANLSGYSHSLWFTEVGAYRCMTSTGAYQGDADQNADAAWMTGTMLALPNVAHAFYYGLASGAPTPIGTPGTCRTGDGQDSVLYSGDPNDGKYHARPAARAIFGPSALAATTGAASDVAPAVATLSGSVNPGGISPAWFRFQYGTTTSYGSTTATIAVGPGANAVSGTGSLSGLTPGTTYHYRIVGTNSDGATVNGADRTFTTMPYLSGAPSVLTASGAIYTMFTGNDDNLHVFAWTPGGAGAVGGAIYGIAPYTSVSAVLTGDGTVQAMFNGSDGNLHVYTRYPGGSGSVSTPIYGMAANTSPSAVVTASGEIETAFVAADGNLHIYAWKPGISASVGPAIYGAAPNTSPHSVVTAGGEIETALNANNGNLHIYQWRPGAGGSVSSAIYGMAAGTSPQSVVTAGGVVETAFQANNGNFHVFGWQPGGGGGVTGAIYGAAPGTSPQSVIAPSGEIDTALNANNGNLHIYRWTAGSGGSVGNAISPMAARTNPSSVVAANGQIETAFIADDGLLHVYQWFPGGAGAVSSGLYGAKSL
jgi:hypothetical protein